MLMVLIILILSSFLYYLYRQNHLIQISRYELKFPHSADRLNGIRIVQITDLHIPNGGASVQDIIKKTKDLDPHLIVMTGDLIHAGVKDFPRVELSQLGKGLSAIAPVYAVMGNHDFGSGHLQKWRDTLKSSNVRVLENKAEWVPLGEGGFLIMGLAEKEQTPSKKQDRLANIALPPEKAHLSKILLAHHPEHFASYLTDKEKAPDLTFSGHTHGGQVVLPIVGGLVAPGQGKLPKYDYGLFSSESDPSKRLIVSRGLGNSTFPLRIHNRPEIVMLTLR